MAGDAPAQPEKPAPQTAPVASTPAPNAAQQQPVAAEEPPKPTRTTKAMGKLKGLGFAGSIRELCQDLFHSDRPTRKMARYFVLSVAGIVGVVVLSGIYFKDLRKQLKDEISDTGDAGKNLSEFIKKQADVANTKFNRQVLGTFTVELTSKVEAEGAKRPPGVMNLAELDIVVDCDEKETCDFIEDRMPAVRNEVTNVLTSIDREELLSREGKRRLKQRIMTRLNMWLPKGKIENLYIDKLVIS